MNSSQDNNNQMGRQMTKMNGASENKHILGKENMI